MGHKAGGLRAVLPRGAHQLPHQLPAPPLPLQLLGVTGRHLIHPPPGPQPRYLSIYIYVYISIFLFIYIAIYIYVYIFIYLSIYL